MHKIKVDNQKCSLCNSLETISYAIFSNGKYRIVTECHNVNCICNNLDTHTPISSGNTTSGD